MTQESGHDHSLAEPVPVDDLDQAKLDIYVNQRKGEVHVSLRTVIIVYLPLITEILDIQCRIRNCMLPFPRITPIGLNLFLQPPFQSDLSSPSRRASLSSRPLHIASSLFLLAVRVPDLFINIFQDQATHKACKIHGNSLAATAGRHCHGCTGTSGAHNAVGHVSANAAS